MEQNDPRFPQQDKPEKTHGTSDDSSKKDKQVKKPDKNESTHLTDRSGEERKEDYINTDERKRDLDKRGL